MAEKTKQKITENMTFTEVLQKHPETAMVFMEQGMHCLGCAAAHFETIGQGAEAHGIDVKKLIEELNKTISKKKKAE